MKDKSPIVAAALSLVPGLGQLYIGKRKKAAALLCIDAGIVLSLLFFYSRLTVILAILFYSVTVVPAAVECFLIAKTGRKDWVLGPPSYVVFMLLITGFGALPLLWQDPRFSRRSKIAWTVAVPVLAGLYFWGLALAAPYLECLLSRFSP